MERAIGFRNNRDFLTGILHTPEEQTDRESAVVFLNAGLVCRAGPERLYVKAARWLSERGFTCLRFDFPGIGNSGGELGEINFDLHSDTSCIQRAIDLLVTETGIRKVILVGMCTSARSAVWTARKDPRVHSLVLFSLPIWFDRTRRPLIRGTRARREKRKQNPGMGIRQKVKANPLGSAALRAWQSTMKFRYSLYNYPLNAARALSLMMNREKIDPVLQEGIDQSCSILLDEGKRIFFVYGEDDRVLIDDFLKFIRPAEGENTGHRIDSRDYLIIGEAGHALSGMSIQQEVIEHVGTWLENVESAERVMAFGENHE